MSYKLKPLSAAIGVAGILLSVTSLTATAGNLGVAAKAGTLGWGLEADYILNNKFSVRVQANQLDYDYDMEEDGIEYQAQLGLSSFGTLIDWHPFSGAFRISVGGFSNSNEVTGSAGGPGEYEIGNETYVASDDFRLGADITMGKSFAPSAGIGWGHSTANHGGLLLSLDIGVLFQGETTVDLTAAGSVSYGSTANSINVATDPTFQQQLQLEEQNLQNDLADFDLYPVITFGIGYRF